MQLHQCNSGISSLGILLNTTIQNFWSVLRTTFLPAFIRNTFPIWQSLSHYNVWLLPRYTPLSSICPSHTLNTLEYDHHHEAVENPTTVTHLVWCCGMCLSATDRSQPLSCVYPDSRCPWVRSHRAGHLMSSAARCVNSLIPGMF